MSEIIDERYVSGHGLDLRVRVEPDYETTPQEFDCYDAADIAAWRADEWRFVVVVVSDENDGTWTSLGGVEYGMMPTVTIDMDRIIGDHLDDMRGELEAARVERLAAQ